MSEYKGSLDAKGMRFAVVVSRFNEAFSSRLLSGALDRLERLGAAKQDIDVFWVPGAFEVPHASRNAAATGSYDAVVALGVVIRGATPHFDLVAGEAARGIAAVARDTGVPTTFGVVTADTLEQAAERCGSKHGNRGADAAEAAVEMASLERVFAGLRRGSSDAAADGGKRSAAEATRGR